MKKLVLSLALLTGLGMTAYAQELQSPARGPEMEKNKNLTPEEKAKKDASRAEKDLGLTADQKIKWETASLSRIKSNQPIHEKLRGSTTPEERKDLRKQARTNHESFENTVNTFLTADQKVKWTQIKVERKNKVKVRHGKHGQRNNSGQK